MNKKNTVLLIIIFLIAVGIRFYDPTFRSLWGDEGHSVYTALVFKDNMGSAIESLIKDSHLPAYFTLLSGWITFLGVSEYSLRLLSIVIGVFCVVAFYFFTKEIFDKKTALFSTFLLAISPLAVFHSQEIRMYGLMLFFSILSSFYYWKLILGEKGSLNLVGYIAFTTMLVLTHIYGALLLGAQFIFLLFDYGQEKKISIFIRLILGQLMIVALVSPLYARILFTNLMPVISGTADMAFSVFPWYFKFLLIFFVLSLGETVAPWNIVVSLPAGLIFGYLLVRNLKWVRDKKIIFLLVMCLFPILFSVILLKPTMPKYLIAVLPFYLLLIGHSLTQVEERYWRYFLLLGIILVQFFSTVNYFCLKEYHNSNQIEPWRQVASLIRENYRKGDIIVATKYFTAYRLLNYYLNLTNKPGYSIFCLQKENYDPGRAKMNYYPVFDAEGNPINILNISPPRIWFVTHILDDRTFPPGYVEAYRAKIKQAYSLIWQKNYIAYAQTLAAKLPIKRHKPGSYRITIELYIRR